MHCRNADCTHMSVNVKNIRALTCEEWEEIPESCYTYSHSNLCYAMSVCHHGARRGICVFTSAPRLKFGKVQNEELFLKKKN